MDSRTYGLRNDLNFRTCGLRCGTRRLVDFLDAILDILSDHALLVLPHSLNLLLRLSAWLGNTSNTEGKRMFQRGTMIKFQPLYILGASHNIPWKNKNAVWHLQTRALFPGIFEFEKSVTYTNEMTDDVIHSTRYYFKYIELSWPICSRPLKIGWLIVLHETYLWV